MLVNFISALGRNAINFGRALGRAGLLLFGALVGKPQVRKHFPLFIKQLHVLGVQSLLIIMLSGLFIGMVLGLQGYVVLVDFAAETSLGQLVALSLLRELGPVVTFICRSSRFRTHCRNWFNESHRTIIQLGNDGGRSVASGNCTAFLGRHYRHANPFHYFYRDWNLGWLFSRCGLERCRCR